MNQVSGIDKDAGMAPEPYDEIAAQGRPHACAQFGLEVGRARAGPAASQQRLLDQAAAIHAGAGPPTPAIRRPEQSLGCGRQIRIEGAQIRELAGSDGMACADQCVQRQAGACGGDAMGDGEGVAEQIGLDIADRAIPSGSAPAARLDRFKHIEGLAVQELADRIPGLVGYGGETVPAAAFNRRGVAFGPNQTLERQLGQVGPGQQKTRIEVGREGHPCPIVPKAEKPR